MKGHWGELGNVFLHGRLAPGWQGTLKKIVHLYIKPNFGPDKPYRGVRIGDEICTKAGCLTQTLAPVATFLKAALGPTAVVSTQEMLGTYLGMSPEVAQHNEPVASIPGAIDLVCASGGYDGYMPGQMGTEEVNKSAPRLEPLFKLLQPHQQAMLLPGIFGCLNNQSDFGPPEVQGARVVRKLEAFWDWANREPKVAGLDAWHWFNESDKLDSGPCDMKLGAEALPGVPAKLREIGLAIVR